MLDFTSVEARLYVRGKERYATKFGAMMSVVSGITLLILSIYFFYFFVQGGGMSVVYYIQDVTALEFNYNFYDWPMMFALTDFVNGSVDPRLLTIVPMLKNTTGFISASLDLEPCEYGKNLNIAWNSAIDSVTYENSLWTKQTNGNLSISYDLSTSVWSDFDVFIYKCRNTTCNNNFCFPKETIDNYLQTNLTVQLSFLYATNTFDHTNQTNPAQKSSYESIFALNPQFLLQYYEFIRPVNYTTDVGSVFEDLTTVTGYIRDTQKSRWEIVPFYKEDSYQDLVASPYIAPNFGSIDLYNRKYQKLKDVAANIGGVMQIVMS